MAQALEESKVWYIYGNMYSLLITLLEQVIKNKKEFSTNYLFEEQETQKVLNDSTLIFFNHSKPLKVLLDKAKT